VLSDPAFKCPRCVPGGHSGDTYKPGRGDVAQNCLVSGTTCRKRSTLKSGAPWSLRNALGWSQRDRTDLMAKEMRIRGALILEWDPSVLNSTSL
jgi:hypothetical protein